MENLEKFIEEKNQSNQPRTVDFMTFYKTKKRVLDLEETLRDIRGIAERNQYGNPEIGFRLIKEKVNEILKGGK